MRIPRIVQSILLGALVFGVVVGGVWLFTGESSPVAFTIGLSRLIRQRERTLLYETDHAVIANVMRDFATERRWSSDQPMSGAGHDPWMILGSDPSLPPAVRVLKPSSVFLFQDYVELEFGGALMHFGIRTFRPGLPGHGTKWLAEGVWFYAEDGRVPSQ